VKPLDSIKVSEKRLSDVSFTHDGKSAPVEQRDEGGVAVLNVDGSKVTLTKERVSSAIAPYAIDVSSDGKWVGVGSVGLAGLPGQLAPGDADLITLVDVSKRPFRAAQHLSVPSVPEGVAISPDGKWIVAQSLNGSNLTPKDQAPVGRSSGVSPSSPSRTAWPIGSMTRQAAKPRRVLSSPRQQDDSRPVRRRAGARNLPGPKRYACRYRQAPQARRRPGLDPDHALLGHHRPTNCRHSRKPQGAA
jgi:hypothetical protein